VEERFTLGEELNFTEDDLKEAFDHTLAPGKVSQGRAYGPFFCPSACWEVVQLAVHQILEPKQPTKAQ
jgi:hypothetical protein